MNYDLLTFRYFNNLAGNNLGLDYLGIFLADYLPYLVIIFLFVSFLWFKKERLKNIIMFSVAFSSGLIARFIVKSFILIFYQRPRPYVALQSVHKLISMSPGENWQSFPSGHAIFFFALATAIYFNNKKLGWSLIIISVVIGITRVFVGVHYPSDIIAGASLGVLTAFLIQKLYLKWHNAIDKILKKVFFLLI